MKILYAVQATGNGHISRATEILPYLLKKGTVDIFLSGSNYALENDLPIVYRSKGISLMYDQDKASVDVLNTIKQINCKRIWQEVNELPIKKYDLIVNDFEAITSLACRIRKIPSIHFGHQASFRSKLAPRPDHRNITGEWILANYAVGSRTIGLHFNKYDKFIFPPIIKETVLGAEPIDLGHITIYLAQYHLEFLVNIFSQFKKQKFHLFSSAVSTKIEFRNITILPISKEAFTESMITCKGLISGAGFETPAEALYLKKKIMVIPLKGQYEQACNAAALKRDFNVPVLPTITTSFTSAFYEWLNRPAPLSLNRKETNEEIISVLFT